MLEVVACECFGKRTQTGRQAHEQILETVPIALFAGADQFLRIGKLDRVKEASHNAPSGAAARIPRATGQLIDVLAKTGDLKRGRTGIGLVEEKEIEDQIRGASK